MIKKYANLEDFMADYEQYPQSFNMLVDLQSIQEFSDLYKPVINLVQVSTNPEDGDIYWLKNAADANGNKYPPTNPHYALTVRGLNKIRVAADAQFVEVRTETDHKNQVVTGHATIKFHGPTGDWAYHTDSKTVSMLQTFKNGDKTPDVEATQKAISKAQNRCIRRVFNIKGHYPKGQLENPFVIVYAALNDKIPEVRHAKILAAVAPNALLYGRKPLAQLTAVKEEHVDPETGEIIDGGAQG